MEYYMNLLLYKLYTLISTQFLRGVLHIVTAVKLNGYFNFKGLNARVLGL